LLRLFCKKSDRVHFAAPPLQITTTSLGCDLVLGADLKDAYIFFVNEGQTPSEID
jgi:hypothetical protein